MPLLRVRTVRQKLVLIMALTSGITLISAGSAVVLYELGTSRDEVQRELSTLAAVIGANCTAALTFDDAAAARDLLRSLSHERPIILACIYDGKGARFAWYRRSNAAGAEVPAQPPADGAFFSGDHVSLTEGIVLDGKRIGTIHSRADLSGMYKRMSRYTAIVGLVGVLCGALAIALSLWGARTVIDPIQRLVVAASEIAAGDLGRRVQIESRDEIGELGRAFDSMVARLQASTGEITAARDYVDNVIRSMNDSLIVVNPDATLRTVSATTLDLLGYEEHELLGQRASVLVTGDVLQGTQLVALMREGKVRDKDMTYRAKDGTLIPVTINGSVIRDKDGRELGFVCVARDMRETMALVKEAAMAAAHKDKAAELEALLVKLRETQMQLVESSKLASLGEMAAGVAHEIQNPVDILLGRIAQLKAALATGAPDRHKLIESLHENTKRIQGIVESLLRFSRADTGTTRRSDLNDEVKSALSLVRQSIVQKARIEIILNLDASPLPIRVRGSQIQQVLINLLQNARDAIEETLALAGPESGAQAASTIEIRTVTRERNGRPGVELSVKDNGSGIDKDIIARIFDPFFTTKGPDRGTGLGLSVSRRIVQDHGGDLWCTSRPTQGTLFGVWLPREERRGA